MALSNINQKWFKTELDDLIVLHGILEMVDGYVLGYIISLLDKLADKLKPEFAAQLNPIFDNAREGDYDKACDLLGNFLSDVIDTPVIDGSQYEEDLYDSAVKTIFIVLFNLFNKRAEVPRAIPFKITITKIDG